ncbi:hypothetical protein KSF73_13825 [Burkholderiaceae bacterium DAT-1]|nr:hypothetical protein [Burkholderiaceae bacterium DAT-1]
MQKFGFRIKTRAGAVVDNLVIQGQDMAHAESKLRQIYHQAQIVEACVLSDVPTGQVNDLEGAISLILSQEDPLGR